MFKSKKFGLLVGLFLTFACVSTFAQVDYKNTKDPIKNNVNKSNKSEEVYNSGNEKKSTSLPENKASNTAKTTSKSAKISLADLAKKYYSAEDIEEMDDCKREKVNFMYTSSFKVVCKACSSANQKEISSKVNLSAYEHLRQMDNSVIVPLKEHSGYSIELISRNELNSELEKINAKYKN